MENNNNMVLVRKDTIELIQGRRREIREIREELNGKENQDTIKDSKTKQSKYIENSNKIVKFLASFIKNKAKEGTYKEY